MRFFKKNKFTIITIIIFLSLVVLGLKIESIVLPNTKKAIYGDRLDNIEKYKVGEDEIELAINYLKEDKKVVKVTESIHGKIICFIVQVTDATSIQDAKKIANAVLDKFSKDEKSYYSFQVFVKKSDEKLNNFPIIGYKNPTSDVLIFTKDREVTTNEE